MPDLTALDLELACIESHLRRIRDEIDRARRESERRVTFEDDERD